MTLKNSEAVIEPSPYQRAVLDFVKTGKGSAVVIAVAGAGKTKTIELALPLIPEHQSVSVLAFNKAIADELNVRIDRLREDTGRAFANTRAKTFHSLGIGAVAKQLNCNVRALQTDSNKCRQLARKLLGDGTMEEAMYGSFIVKLVGFAKGQGIGAITPDTEDAWWSLVQHHDLTLEHDTADESVAVEHARQLLKMSNDAAKGKYIDFDDMLYLPLLWKLRLWPNDWVIVDEAQDTNPVRRALAKLALKAGGRSLWVGDPKQAIYGFTGASHDAIDLIKAQFNAIELPLTVCYRCARSVVEYAKTIVPYIEASEFAPQGLVEELDDEAALAQLGDDDVILCRNVAPMIEQAYAIIAQGRGCTVLGRDLGKGLTDLIKRMKAQNLEQLEAKLNAYGERETAKFMSRGEEQKADRLNDTIACINVIVAHLDEDSRTVSALIRQIEGMFSDHSSVLTLSTVHKAKGREWKRVAILHPELMPSKWARQDWQVVQEHNLRYVAYTRAAEHLIIMTGPAAPKVDESAPVEEPKPDEVKAKAKRARIRSKM